MSELKHSLAELHEWQQYPLSMKVAMAKERIRAFVNEYGIDGVYVSISGGKDSLVLLHLARSLYPDIKAVFVNTTLEFDSVRRKATENADVILTPKMNFAQVITEFGYPIASKEVAKRVSEYRNAEQKGKLEQSSAYKEFNGLLLGNGEFADKPSLHNKEKWKFLVDAPFKISHKCCVVNKEGVALDYEKTSNRHPIVGTMAEESRARRKEWQMRGCNSYDGNRPMSKPLSFWTEQDILRYIKTNKIDIADVYGNIVPKFDDDPFDYSSCLFEELNYYPEEVEFETTGESRTGCVACMFGIVYDKDRFVRLKQIEPKKYSYILRGGYFDTDGMWKPSKEGLGYKFVIDWLNEHGNLGIKY